VNKKKDEWRKHLNVGDLVMMKSGHMALLTDVHMRFSGTNGSEYPHIKMQFVDDLTDGSCSAWRVEEVLSASR
jgi:hypothetical protein